MPSWGTGHRLVAARRRRVHPRASARAGEKPRGGGVILPPVVMGGRLALQLLRRGTE
jgi:hypothetical protein